MSSRAFLLGLLCFCAARAGAEGPDKVIDGLAMYQRGAGEPILLMPYPHGSTIEPMAESALARVLVNMGRTVVTFDPPGAYASKRPHTADLAEMIACAEETLEVFNISEPIDLAGHSMGGLCALALAVERPLRIKRLVLIGATSGFPAVRRWGIHKHWRLTQKEFWQCRYHGIRLMLGLGRMKDHKMIGHLNDSVSYVDKRYVPKLSIDSADQHRPPPVRDDWLAQVRRIDYASRLSELDLPVLICVGREDPQTPPVMSELLHRDISGSQLVIFEHSGHAPFIEEEPLFRQALQRFLREH